MPPHHYWHPRIFRPSYGPVVKVVFDRTFCQLIKQSSEADEIPFSNSKVRHHTWTAEGSKIRGGILVIDCIFLFSEWARGRGKEGPPFKFRRPCHKRPYHSRSYAVDSPRSSQTEKKLAKNRRFFAKSNRPRGISMYIDFVKDWNIRLDIQTTLNTEIIKAHFDL